MWLTRRPIPDIKTIANLCKDKGIPRRLSAVRGAVPAAWLFSEALVAIDGNDG